MCAGHWLIIGTSFFGIVETAQLFFHLYEKPELGLKHVCHAQKVHTTIFVHIVTQEFLLCTLVCNYVRQYLHKKTPNLLRSQQHYVIHYVINNVWPMTSHT